MLLAAGDGALAPPSPAELLGLVDAHLARPGAPRAREAHWSYARWKPGTSLTAGFELGYPDGERRWVTWKRYAGGKASDLIGRRERETAPDVADERLGEHCILPEGGAHLWAPPYDRELPGLERAFDLRRTKRWFLDQGLFPGLRVRSGGSRAELLRYKPERRAVLRLDLRLRPLEGGPRSEARLAARALPPAEARRVSRARLAWQAGAPAGLAPLLLAHEDSSGLLYEQWLDVQPADFPDPEFARAAGGLLAKLHAGRAPACERIPEFSLQGARELLATQSELAPWSGRLSLAERSDDGEHTWIHGDFHPDQVVVSRSDASFRLLDLDRLGAGCPLRDLAAWLCDELIARPQLGLAQAGVELLAGYAEAGGRVPEHLRLAERVAAELVQRAAGALRRLESGAVDKAAGLLERARDLAPRGVLFA